MGLSLNLKPVSVIYSFIYKEIKINFLFVLLSLYLCVISQVIEV